MWPSTFWPEKKHITCRIPQGIDYTDFEDFGMVSAVGRALYQEANHSRLLVQGSWRIFSTEFGKRSFSYLAPTVWHDLHLDTRLSPTADIFTRRLRQYFSHSLPCSAAHLATAGASDSALLLTLCALQITILLRYYYYYYYSFLSYAADKQRRVHRNTQTRMNALSPVSTTRVDGPS